VGLCQGVCRRNDEPVNIAMRLQYGQVVAEAVLEDTHYSPDLVDDMSKKLGTALGNAIITVKALDLEITLSEECD
jgi:hypothetical protein